MVDAFWLASCRDASRRSSLVEVQANDLMEKYGERMGKRKLDAVVIAAVEEVGDARAASSSSAGGVGGTDGIRGLVTVEVRLLERGRDLLSSEESEIALTRAVSSLGPKQRREYKDASAMEVANGLLSPDYIAICSLSNLCVSHAARRGGVAKRLCTEAERVARDVFGFDEMYLRVEKSNLAALGLYEERLGYVRSFDVNGATAMRADADSGSFVEVNTDIVVLRKRI
jgi:ribosomal protein S18 acetylase RimI-like enzyme